MTHLDGTGDENLVVNTTAFPTRSPANPGFVHLNMVLGLSTDPVLVGPHHARAELVENLKGRLVARKTKLPLKLHGGHGRASDWRPDKRPRTRRSAECGYAPSLFPPSARCSGGTCGSAGRQGGFQSGTALPPCRSAGRQSRLPAGFLQVGGAGASSGKSRWNSGSECGNGRSARSRTSMARSLYPVCAHSGPSGCGCKPDRQASIEKTLAYAVYWDSRTFPSTRDTSPERGSTSSSTPWSTPLISPMPTQETCPSLSSIT